MTAALGSVFLCNLDGIDFYPSIAGAPTGFAYSGAVQTLTASVPTTSDVPWLERTPAFYQTAYGAPQPQLAGGGTVTPVSGYSGDLAYTLALLTTATYGRFQHPDLSQPLPSGYTRAADVAVNGVVWASIYSSGDRTVVASRGACSWIELLAFMGNGSLLPLPWFTSGGRILQGCTPSIQAMRRRCSPPCRGFPAWRASRWCSPAMISAVPWPHSPPTI